MDTRTCQYLLDRAREEAVMLYGDMRNVRWYLEKYDACLRARALK